MKKLLIALLVLIIAAWLAVAWHYNSRCIVFGCNGALFTQYGVFCRTMLGGTIYIIPLDRIEPTEEPVLGSGL